MRRRGIRRTGHARWQHVRIMTHGGVKRLGVISRAPGRLVFLALTNGITNRSASRASWVFTAPIVAQHIPTAKTVLHSALRIPAMGNMFPQLFHARTVRSDRASSSFMLTSRSMAKKQQTLLFVTDLLPFAIIASATTAAATRQSHTRNCVGSNGTTARSLCWRHVALRLVLTHIRRLRRTTGALPIRTIERLHRSIRRSNAVLTILLLIWRVALATSRWSRHVMAVVLRIRVSIPLIHVRRLLVEVVSNVVAVLRSGHCIHSII